MVISVVIQDITVSRAAARLNPFFKQIPMNRPRCSTGGDRARLFSGYPGRLSALRQVSLNGEVGRDKTFLGGEQTLYVQKHETMVHAPIPLSLRRFGIERDTAEWETLWKWEGGYGDGHCWSPVFRNTFPGSTDTSNQFRLSLSVIWPPWPVISRQCLTHRGFYHILPGP